MRRELSSSSLSAQSTLSFLCDPPRKRSVGNATAQMKTLRTSSLSAGGFFFASYGFLPSLRKSSTLFACVGLHTIKDRRFPVHIRLICYPLPSSKPPAWSFPSSARVHRVLKRCHVEQGRNDLDSEIAAPGSKTSYLRSRTRSAPFEPRHE